MRFEEFELNTEDRTLRRNGELVPLNAKTFEILAYLASRPKQLVTRDELLEAAWPGTSIEDGNLNQHIFLLRRALAAAGAADPIVVTVPGKGYRFNTDIQQDAALPPALATSTGIVSGASDDAASSLAWQLAVRRNRGWLIVACAVGIVAAVWASVNTKHPRISHFDQITYDGNEKTLGGSEGNRVYFSYNSEIPMEQVQASGGVGVPVDIPRSYHWAGAVSPDGSKMLVVSDVSGLGPSASLWTFQIVGGALRRIANSKQAAWSPDGQRIVYANLQGDLYICNADGADAHLLKSVGGNIRRLSWSPDGALIRFSKDDQIWQISSDGVKLEPVLPELRHGGSQIAGSWTRDGGYLFTIDGQIWMLEKPTFPANLWPAKPVQLTFGPTIWDKPTEMPDGSRMYANGKTQRGELIRIDRGRGSFPAFLRGLSAEFVAFSPDGKRVAYVTYPEGSLWVAGLDGSHRTQLTSRPAYPKSIRWSPDGKTLIFVDADSDGRSCLFRLTVDGSGKPERLLPQDSDAENDPTWSPDGRSLVYSTTQHVGESTDSEIRVLDLATKKVTTLPDSKGLSVPHWSPDGKWISAITLDASSSKLYNVEKRSWSSLDTGTVAFPEWSRDSKSIYYLHWPETGSSSSVVRIAVGDGKKEAIADLADEHLTGVYSSWMGLDPDDSPLLLRDIGRDDIYALYLEKK